MTKLRNVHEAVAWSEVARRAFLQRVLALGAGSFLCGSRAFAQNEAMSRAALVIGNSDYGFGRLRNPVNDSRVMASSLRNTGFDVTALENGTLMGMLDAMKAFVARAKSSQVRLFFFAGHGIQAKGVNFLVPVDTPLIDESRLSATMVSVSDLVDQLTLLKKGVNILVLDACRTGLGSATRRRGSAAMATSGLAQMAAPSGTLIAFSTSPGAVALDGSAENSTYTKHLAKNLSVPGLPIEQLFKRVRISVAQETGQAQIPWETSSLMGDFCFRTTANGQCVTS